MKLHSRKKTAVTILFSILVAIAWVVLALSVHTEELHPDLRLAIWLEIALIAVLALLNRLTLVLVLVLFSLYILMVF